MLTSDNTGNITGLSDLDNATNLWWPFKMCRLRLIIIAFARRSFIHSPDDMIRENFCTLSSINGRDPGNLFTRLRIVAASAGVIVIIKGLPVSTGEAYPPYLLIIAASNCHKSAERKTLLKLFGGHCFTVVFKGVSVPYKELRRHRILVGNFFNAFACCPAVCQDHAF